ncbi:MAG: hypothetical protein R2867_32300 [Caldilineaceae bacterium]
MTGGKIQAVCGTARHLIDQVPVGAPIHDFRVSFTPLSPEQAAADAWQRVDADMGYTIPGASTTPDGSTASVLWQASEWPPVAIPTRWLFMARGVVAPGRPVLPAGDPAF